VRRPSFSTCSDASRTSTASARRCSRSSYRLPASVGTLALFIFIGRVDSDVLTVGAAGVPAIVAGVIIGVWARGQVEAELFRRLVVGLLVCVSVLVIAFTVLGLR